MSTSTSSASGKTATVAAEVWIRPWLSVSGTRWTRCVPLSNLKRLHAPAPRTSKLISFRPPSSASLRLMTSTEKRRRSAYMEYIR